MVKYSVRAVACLALDKDCRTDFEKYTDGQTDTQLFGCIHCRIDILSVGFTVVCAYLCVCLFVCCRLGVLPPLVSSLSGKDEQTVRDAVDALCNLVQTNSARASLKRIGGIKPVVRYVGDFVLFVVLHVNRPGCF